jgi:hypothetical protein
MGSDQLMARSGVEMTVDKMAKIAAAIDVLSTTRVMVGIPESRDTREESGSLGNAEIGYLMENGIPEHNVPARPHLVPGVRRARAQTSEYLRQAGRLALDGRPDAVTRAYMAAGQTAVTSVKGLIREGVPPPLADSTVRARARGRKGARLELERRAAGQAASTDLVKPLINTGQYLNSITYALRRVKK